MGCDFACALQFQIAATRSRFDSDRRIYHFAGLGGGKRVTKIVNKIVMNKLMFCKYPHPGFSSLHVGLRPIVRVDVTEWVVRNNSGIPIKQDHTRTQIQRAAFAVHEGIARPQLLSK